MEFVEPCDVGKTGDWLGALGAGPEYRGLIQEY